MDTFRHDLLYALKGLSRDRAYAAAVILTLAVCLGANTAVFTVVRSVLLRPLPYPEPQRLLSSYDSYPNAGVDRTGTSVPNYADRRAMPDVFSSVALYQSRGYKFGGSGARAEDVSAMDVTPSFFDVLGATAERGRLFTEAEGTPGKNKVVLVSHAFAARQPGGAAAIVGRQIRLDDDPYDVVGVLPKTFFFLRPDVAMFVPLAFGPADFGDDRRHSQNHEMLARLAPGVTLERAQARVDAQNAAVVERAGVLKEVILRAGYTTRMLPLEADVVRNVKAALQMLWAGVLCVVVIAAVNITNLALARTSGRMKELVTRSALGANRVRVARQLITEATVLTAIGAGLGILLGFNSLGMVEWIGFTDLPRAHEIGLDAVVVSVTFAPALLLGVVVGAAPLVRLARADLSGVLRNEGRSGTTGRASTNVRRSLVIGQVALAFLLVVAAGLLLTSFDRLLRVHPGFVADNVLTGRVSPLASRYPDETALRTYVERALERVRALPGVEAAGVSSYLPFSSDGSSSVIIPEGHVAKPGESILSPSQLYVSPGYLEALRVELVRGRFFTDADAATAPGVVIVDARLAARFWPNQNPVGRRVYRPDTPDDVRAPGPGVKWMHVVGVVGAVKLRGLEEGENARVGAYYIPYAQSPSRGVGWAIRSRGTVVSTAVAVQRALAEIDPEMPMTDVQAMSERVEQSLNPRRAPMLLSLGFGVVALLLASIGLYGVLAYHVGQRTREFGIRLALGSDAPRILRLVLGEAGVLVGLGLIAGIGGTLALHGTMTGQLYGTSALDGRVLLGAVAILAVTSLVACLGPARRAVRISPLVALSRQ
jgi:predicted permease